MIEAPRESDINTETLADQAEAEGADLPTPSQGGSSGGVMQRDIGARDEDKSAFGGDPQPTSVRKSDKPDGGDEPNLPHRDGGGGQSDHVPPRRT